jgi:hypothetical protein
MPDKNRATIPEIGNSDRKTIGGIPAMGSPNLAKLKGFLSEIPSPPIPDSLPAHLPAIFPTRDWIGGSNFWYSTRKLFGLDLNGQPKQTPFSFREYNDEVRFVSALNWSICQQRRPGVLPKYLADASFTAAWIQRVLFDFFGFQTNHRVREVREDNQLQEEEVALQAAEEAEEMEVEAAGVDENNLSFRPFGGADDIELNWTLGKLILFAFSSEPKEMASGVLLQVNANRKEAESLDEKARRMDEKAHDMKLRAKDFRRRAQRTEKAMAERAAEMAVGGITPRPSVGANQIQEDKEKEKKAADMANRWEDLADAARVKANTLRREADQAETNGVNGIEIAERWSTLRTSNAA